MATDNPIGEVLVRHAAWAAVDAVQARLRAGQDVPAAVAQVVEGLFGSLAGASDRQELTERVAGIISSR